jgi:glyoxylase-like metal-dependent hydrolase (beta-lactamase superfamily II)
MRNVARNVWQLAVIPPNVINAYLVDNVLVDAGTRAARRKILRALDGVSLESVALTHCHPDHQGSAAAVCEQFGVPLACHPADRDAMEGRGPMVPVNRWIRLSDRLMSGPRRAVDQCLEEGQTIAGFRVIHTPGHTPGHVSLFRESDGVLIAGDVVAGIHPLLLLPGLHEPPAFFCADARENRRSLRKLGDLKPRTILFGHGPPLRDAEKFQRFVGAVCP